MTPEEDATGDRRRRPVPPRTSLIGREAELAAIVGLLDTEGRLLTITGRSGSGKTRLAVEVAARVAHRFAGGAVIVDCASIADTDFLLMAVAGALDVAVVDGTTPADALVRSLAFEPTLILADDLDRVPGGAERLLEVLDRGRGSRIVATAGAPLRVHGEQVVRLGPLPVGPAIGEPRIGAPAPAVALFCERARSVDASFQETDDELEAIASLVARLDGLPLAIELAAARVPTLPAAAQLEMLGRISALDLASSAAHARESDDARRSGLRGALDWTHRILGERERTLFRRLGAFAGPVTIEAIAGVCSDGEPGLADLLDALSALVDVHLVEPEPAGGGARFRLLPAVAEYAREQLTAAGEAGTLAERHSTWYAALAGRADGLDDPAHLARLAADRAELRQALEWCVANRDIHRAAALAVDIAPLWYRQGLFPRAREWYDAGLAGAAAVVGTDAAVDAAVHARVMLWRALIATLGVGTGDAASAPDLLARGLALARASGDTQTLLFGLAAVVRSVFVTGDVAGVAAATMEGLALSRAVGDARWETRFMCWAGMAASRTGDAATAARLGAAALARATHDSDPATVIRATMLLNDLPAGTPGVPTEVPTVEALLAIARETGDVTAAGWMLTRLAWRALRAGDMPRMAAHCVETLRLGQRTGLRSAAGIAVAVMVMCAVQRGDDPVAAILHGGLTPMLPALRVGLPPTTVETYGAAVDAARARIGVATFDPIVADGMLLTWDAVLDAALEYATALAGTALPRRRGPAAGIRPGPVATGGPERLTPREVDVLRLLARGDTNKEIGLDLGLSPKTVMHHSVSIYGKLGVRGRAEATAWAHRNGLLDETEREAEAS